MFTKATQFKKLSVSLWTLLLALFIFTSCAEDDTDLGPGDEDDDEIELVDIEDEVLLEIILETLNLNSPADLTVEKIKELTQLQIISVR